MPMILRIDFLDPEVPIGGDVAGAMLQEFKRKIAEKIRQ
jgi:hypothetical protein